MNDSRKQDGVGSTGGSAPLPIHLPDALPCPFCGSARIVKGERYFAMCVDCGATGPERNADASQRKFTGDWNSRFSQPLIVQGIPAAKAVTGAPPAGNDGGLGAASSLPNDQSPGVAAGTVGSAALVANLRADADLWEAFGKALGYMNKAGECRGKKRIDMLRSAADRIEHMLQTLHMAYEHALDTQCPPDQRRLTPDGERELGRRLAQYWCLPNKTTEP